MLGNGSTRKVRETHFYVCMLPMLVCIYAFICGSLVEGGKEASFLFRIRAWFIGTEKVTMYTVCMNSTRKMCSDNIQTLVPDQEKL
jgi:predicted Co/Zn/Cd cation transporter (cation efflux family)